MYFSIIYIQAPLRVVCIGADAAVRIISGKTGDVITTSLVPDLITITDAAYSAGEGMFLRGCAQVFVDCQISTKGNYQSNSPTNPKRLLHCIFLCDHVIHLMI
jgi:hypothetical protein